MENKEYLIHFDHLILFKEKPSEEAWDRILAAFIGAVEKEGAGTCGGMHEHGSVHTCCEEGVTVCQECLEDMHDG